IAVALRVVERRGRAAAVGFELVDARARLHHARARQAYALAVGARLARDFTAVGQPPQVGERIALAIAVIVAVALRLEVAGSEAKTGAAAGQVGIELGFERAVGTGARRYGRCRRAGDRRTRDDVD